jgi:CDP-glycerol glycerophosphotransferase (TagB/SpsB family)
VLYAPTFEGDADYNNYSSLDRFGAEIVRRLLDVPDVRVVYKPHPRVPTSEHQSVLDAHGQVVALLEAASQQEPDAGHATLHDTDILALMPDCQLVVTDVSSVGLDWLYLCTDRPLVIADRYDDAERLRLAAPVSRCADVVDSTNLRELTELVTERLQRDELHLARIAMRHYYFDDHRVGDSTTRFIDSVAEVATLRDTLLEARGGDEESVAT